MKKLALLTVLLNLITVFGYSQSVMISQYIETNSGSTPKGIEIFNYSGSNITFTAGNNLQIFQGTNGGTCSALVNITSGTLNAGEVWVIGTSDLTAYATTNGTNLSGTTTYSFAFNGDDALEVYLAGVKQDVFGTCGTDPGSNWSGSGVSTANQNIQINTGICSGTTTYWSDPSLRFNTVSTNPVADLSGFGDSPTSCLTTCTPPTTQATSINFSSVNETDMTISWTGGNGTNSLVVVSEGTAVTANPSSSTSYTASTTFGSGDDLGSNNYVVYNGTGSSVTITGLTGNTTYYVSIFEFNSSDNCYNTTSPTTNSQTTACPSTPGSTTGFVAVAGNASASLSWTNPSGCFDEVLVVAEDGTIGFSPSGNGTTYTANPIYGNGTCVDCSGSNNEYVVYKGSGTSVTVTGLTNGTSYCFKIWVRYGTSWSVQEVDCGITPTAAIPDDGCGSSDYVSMTINYTGTNPIADIDIDVFIEHTYRGDLQIEVESPTGTVVTIFDGQGGGADNLEATFDDGSANTTYTTNHTLDGTVDETFQPSGGSLSTFNGETPTGTWIIRVCDDASADTGILNDWDITIVESCTPTHTVTSYAPTTGPEGTAVTITGTGFTASTTADIGGIAATVQYVSSTTIIVEIPAGASDNTIDINEGGCEVSTSGNFTLISTAGLCGGSTSFNDLIISEVYDSDANNVWYIELFNPTASAIDLAAENYTIERYATAGDASPTRTIALTGTIPAGGIFLLKIGSSSDDCTESWDFIESGAGINEDDGIMLVHNGTDVDWVECPNNTGYSILRDNTASGPTTTWNAADWTTNNTEDCSDLGTFGIVYDTHPTVTDEPDDTQACEILKSVTASAGSGGGSLTYQWLYNDGNSAGWSNVIAAAFPLATVSGETSANLSITGASTDIETYDGYQFYCEVTEAGSCSTSSDAAQFTARSENDPELITAVVNGCEPGGGCGSEGYNEFFALEIGNVDVDVTDPTNINLAYNTTYPASTTYTDSFTADASLTADFNTENVSNGCGSTLFYDAVNIGTIPANSTVLLMSSNVCASAYDFSNLCGGGPVYLLYSTDGNWGSTGNFANTGAGSRYFSLTITDVNGRATTTEYEYSPNALSGADGDYAEFEYCAAPAYNYSNDACAIKNVTLPVELLFFDAFRKENIVELVWETGSELNNDKFVVMRSVNGEVYHPIGEIKGQGNSTVVNRYTLVDQSPQPGDNFYAIYQYDFDGALTKSPIKLVTFDSNLGFEGYSNGSEIVLEYHDVLPGSKVEIFSIEGKLIESFTLSNSDGKQQINLPTESYYLIRMSNQHESKIIRIMH